MSKTIIGAGPVGCLWALFLKRKGYPVHVYEQQSDPRLSKLDLQLEIPQILNGKSMQILELLNLHHHMSSLAVPLEQKTIGSRSTKLENHYAISRYELNQFLIEKAEAEGVHFHFQNRLIDIDFDTNEYFFQNLKTLGLMTVITQNAFAVDGASSYCRTLMDQASLTNESISPSGYDFKTLVIPNEIIRRHGISPSHIYLWPSNQHFICANPLTNQNLMATIYLPSSGDLSFTQLKNWDDYKNFFGSYHPQEKFLEESLHSELNSEFLMNPIGSFAHVVSDPWHFQDRIALLGDAARGLSPFAGGSLNEGFKDCLRLHHWFEKFQNDWHKIFSLHTQYLRTQDNPFNPNSCMGELSHHLSSSN